MVDYGLEGGSDPFREAELIGSADHIVETLRGFKERLPITDIVHSGPAAGIPIRTEAHTSLKAFAEKMMPTLKSW